MCANLQGLAFQRALRNLKRSKIDFFVEKMVEIVIAMHYVLEYLALKINKKIWNLRNSTIGKQQISFIAV